MERFTVAKHVNMDMINGRDILQKIGEARTVFSRQFSLYKMRKSFHDSRITTIFQRVEPLIHRHKTESYDHRRDFHYRRMEECVCRAVSLH